MPVVTPFRSRIAAGRQRSTHNHRDANEPALIRCAERMGVMWIEAGPLDGWVFLHQHIPVEIKNPDGRNRLTRLQLEYIGLCRRHDWPWLEWRTIEDVVSSINKYRARCR